MIYDYSITLHMAFLLGILVGIGWLHATLLKRSEHKLTAWNLIFPPKAAYAHVGDKRAIQIVWIVVLLGIVFILYPIFSFQFNASRKENRFGEGAIVLAGILVVVATLSLLRKLGRNRKK